MPGREAIILGMNPGRSTLWLVLALAIATLAGPAAAGPAETGKEFVASLGAGQLDRVKRLLDDPRYGGQPPGGPDTYFLLESGYEPNLAFLVGQPFDVSEPTVSEQRSDRYLLDGIIYATAVLPLRFSRGRDQPWVLPVAIALGRRMEFVKFMNFATAPEREADHVTLRLRRRIESGLIRPPAPPPWQQAPGPPPMSGAPPTRPAMGMGGTPSGLIGSPGPTDPAPVILPSGEALTAEQLKRFLPRLSGISLNLHLVRRGRLAPWRVSRWNVTDAILLTDKGQVVMRVGTSGTFRGQ